MREAAVEILNRIIDESLGAVIVRSGLAFGDIALKGEERRDEGASVPEHHRLGDPSLTPELGLHGARRDVLPTGGLEQVLLAIGDLQVTAFVQLADVPSFQPAVDKGLRRRLGILEIALEDVVAFDQDLAIRGDLYLDPGQGKRHGSEMRGPWAVERGGRRGLRQAVALKDLDSKSVEEAMH